ncbi:MAG TPA: FAD-binding oxidoreductase, partial [Planctomycetota bacterium]|nr:FAD-binding oxidoreductase [Planctomycetota bacterium]
SSIYCSTLGGWLAARSAGQASTKYGKIEDMCVGLEAVLPSGEVAVARPTPRSAAGPDWKQVLIGSEGTLGVITRAWLRIAPLPEARRFLCYRFPGVAAGLGAIRRVLRRGLRPSVVRLYDPLDTLVGVSGGGGTKGVVAEAAKAVFERAKHLLLAHPDWAPLLDHLAGGCHAVFVCEGDRDLADLEARAIAAEAALAGAEDRGPGPAEHWMAHRYDVSYKGAPIFREGGFVDTMELAAPWDAIEGVYRRVRAAIQPHAVTLAHFSHAYPEGCSVYFTFAAAVDDGAAAEARYDAIWRDGIAAAQAAGANVSHHHGVGLGKAAFMREELGGFLDAYRAVKAALDPRNVLNPGKMGLP